jgi:hypothetical protein
VVQHWLHAVLGECPTRSDIDLINAVAHVIGEGSTAFVASALPASHGEPLLVG